jgi:hypothetical protein
MKPDDRIEIVLEARRCLHGRHLAQMRACAFRGGEPCRCRGEIALDELLGGGSAA